MKVVVVGAGFAGLTAAIALQERRHQVLLLERRGILGGRATSYVDAPSGEDVDNGTHLMLGAYRATLDLLRRAGASDLLLEQHHLHLDYVDDRGYTSLDCPRLAAPLHLLWGLAGLRMPLGARLQALRLGLAVRFGREPRGQTLAAYFARHGQGAEVRRLLWDPLATAVLNETPERGDASLFWRVLQEAFFRTHAASRGVFLRRGWAAVHDRLAGYFEARGGVLRRRALVESVVVEGGRARGVRYRQRAETKDERKSGVRAEASPADADAVVLACPWNEVAGLLPEDVRAQPPFAGLHRLGASPIVSVELWLDRVVVDRVMVGLRDSEMEWVFDKGRLFGRAGAPQHLSFIVSAARRDLSRPNAELVGSAVATLRRYFPAMADAAVQRSHVLRDPVATFASTPELEALRPPNRTPVPGLFLAGDWTDTKLPATIEGAVRSGLAAAEATSSP
ncbi:MAG: hydroxysqualene dehydroxylase HpnE [Vicinamibacteria bacterium]